MFQVKKPQEFECLLHTTPQDQIRYRRCGILKKLHDFNSSTLHLSDVKIKNIKFQKEFIEWGNREYRYIYLEIVNRLSQYVKWNSEILFEVEKNLQLM